ncbi:MAG: aminopeptidase [Clostridia bacterium]
MNNPARETNFYNCVADVNIPVGEVFTSPKLEGTNGVLHLEEIYLEDLQYKNLRLVFQDGYIQDYSCSNFESEEDNKRYIEENLLFHDTLPLGEFAIGNNTTAYKRQENMGLSICSQPHRRKDGSTFCHWGYLLCQIRRYSRL